MRRDLNEPEGVSADTKSAEEDPNALYRYASPPCFMHEFATWEAENMSPAKLLGPSDELLAGEHARTEVVPEMHQNSVRRRREWDT